MTANQNFDNTKFITGLRAYSALGVFLIHSGGAGLREISYNANKLVDFGKYGVVSFFVISAFTICMSIDKNDKFSPLNYFVKRFLRIAPMFYLVTLLCYFFTDGVLYYNNLFNISNSLYSLFLHLSFFNIFDVRYMNNIIGVEGTVPIEFIYYLIVPFTFFFLQKYPKSIYLVLLIALFITCFSFSLFSPFYNNDAKWLSHNLSLEKYCFTFIIGVIAYLIWKNKKIIIFNEFALLGHLILLGFCIYYELPNQEVYFALWVAVLLFILSSKNWLSILLFENSVIEYIGKISYSIYLIHVPIIHHVHFFDNPFYNATIWLSITIILSSFSYEFIEVKFVTLAHNLKIDKFNTDRKFKHD